MRRLCATLGIVVLSLAVCPARADAYFWAWLDELSGPHFIGFLVEWRVYCKAESVAQERQALVKLNASLRKELQEHSDTLKTATDPDARRYFGNAVLYSASAVAYIEDAIKSIDEDANRDVSPLVLKAFVWRSHASAHFEWGRKIVGKRTDGETPPQEPAEKPLPLGTRSFFPLVGGATLSLCNAKPLHRDRQFLTVSVGYAYRHEGCERRGQEPDGDARRLLQCRDHALPDGRDGRRPCGLHVDDTAQLSEAVHSAVHRRLPAVRTEAQLGVPRAVVARLLPALQHHHLSDRIRAWTLRWRFAALHRGMGPRLGVSRRHGSSDPEDAEAVVTAGR